MIFQWRRNKHTHGTGAKWLSGYLVVKLFCYIFIQEGRWFMKTGHCTQYGTAPCALPPQIPPTVQQRPVFRIWIH